MRISDSILYVGVDDKELDLFEGQYDVHDGISYNSYVILDEKIALMDSVDARKTDEWLGNVEQALNGKAPDYLVVSHMEPDHGGSLMQIAEKYPAMQLVMSAKAVGMLAQFGYGALAGRAVTVKENDTLALGSHTLRFLMAPMVHWPEVMITYEESEQVLFSADAFGRFGALDEEEEWLDEAREYYINIVGKYGGPVQTVLKKAAGLQIAKICPLHGPVLDENLPFYLGKYQTWSSYVPEEKGTLIAYGTLHGNTAQAAKALAQLLADKGETVEVADLARCNLSETVAAAFRYDKVVLAAPTYDGGIFPKMEDFISHLKAKAFQKRKVGLIENGTWAPMAAKQMKALLEGCKDVTFCENTVTIKSTLNDASRAQLNALADELLA
ncbi:MAG: FprA family A-type flavoprotein [Clostridia bacterium]|nr:FprA family A-type flavoprotein [Clostridia bacterium]